MCSSCCWCGRWRSLSRARPRDAALAGALCALSLAIGQEMAPAIAAARRADRAALDRARRAGRDATAAFALAFAAATLALFAATVPPARYARRGLRRAVDRAGRRPRSCGGFGLALLTAAAPASTTSASALAGAPRSARLVAAIAVLGVPRLPRRSLCASRSAAHDAVALQRERGAQHRHACCATCRRRCCPITVSPAIGLALGVYRCRARARRRGAGAGSSASPCSRRSRRIALWQVRGARPPMRWRRRWCRRRWCAPSGAERRARSSSASGARR